MAKGNGEKIIVEQWGNCCAGEWEKGKWRENWSAKYGVKYDFKENELCNF